MSFFRRNLLELTEIKAMLSRADGFLTQHRRLTENEGEVTLLKFNDLSQNWSDAPILEKGEREEVAGMQITVTAGVIDRFLFDHDHQMIRDIIRWW